MTTLPAYRRVHLRIFARAPVTETADLAPAQAYEPELLEFTRG